MFARGGSKETLFPIGELINHFLGAIDFESPRSSSRTPLTFPYTARRNTALTRLAREKDVHLLRYGDPFVDALGNFAATDDRGRVFSLWRYDSQYAPVNPSGSDLCFRLDFLVEADTRAAHQIVSDNVVDRLGPNISRRRADGLLQPLFIRIWLNEQLEEIAEPAEILCRVYRAKDVKGVSWDFNLNPMRWQKVREQKLYVLDIWPELCKRAHDEAKKVVLTHDAVRIAIKRSNDNAIAMREKRIAQLQIRMSRAQGKALDAEKAILAVEEQLWESLIAGIGAPSLKLDSIGAIFLSNQNPFHS
jgi:ATP-dependent helicase HepA